MRQSKTVSGFTLVEMLVVMLLIATLAAIAWISWYSVVQNARLVQQKTDLNYLVFQVQKYRIEHGFYPPDADPGISPDREITFSVRPGYIYDYDHFTANCQEFVKVSAYPTSGRQDDFLNPGIIGEWLRHGKTLSLTVNIRRAC